jgi:hypothetical protein
MKVIKLFTLLISLSLLCGCERKFSMESTGRPVAANQLANEEYKTTTQVSLQQADQSQSMVDAANRKVLLNGDLTLEVASPADAERNVTSIADALGGFVVTSESKQHDTGDPAKQYLEVNLVLRVPAAQFKTAFDQILSTGNRVIQQKKTGQDVTEEFIDLKATLKSDKTAEKGERSIPARLRIQACDDQVCYPPGTLELAIPVNVK